MTIVPTGPMLFEGNPRWKQCWLKWEIMVYDSGQRTWRERERSKCDEQDPGWAIGRNPQTIFTALRLGGNLKVTGYWSWG